MPTARKEAGERKYAERLPAWVNRIVIDIFRAAWAAMRGVLGGSMHAVVMVVLAGLAGGTLRVARGYDRQPERLRKSTMGRLREWARDQYRRLCSKTVAQVKIGLERILRTRFQPESRKLEKKKRDPLPREYRKVLEMATTRPTQVEYYMASFSASSGLSSRSEPVRSEMADDQPLAARVFQYSLAPPLVSFGLLPAPLMPVHWRSSHVWFTDRCARPLRDRSEELDQLLDRVADLVIRRGWATLPLPSVVVNFLSNTEVPTGEHVVSYSMARARLQSDRLYRISSRYLYCLARRYRRIFPEELSLLYDWPVNSPILRVLSDLGMPTSIVLRMLSWGIHGSTLRWMSELIRDVCGHYGVAARVVFYGVGLNTMAAVMNEVLGVNGWVYEASFEANPIVYSIHKAIWGGVVRHQFRRAERAISVTLNMNIAVLSLRCQPFSFLNRYGAEQLPPAINERFAVYRQVARLQPMIIFDEMLGRERMGALGQAWEHVEYLREVCFPEYQHVVLATDPGCQPAGFTNSYREIVVWMLKGSTFDLEGWLVGRGWVKAEPPRVWRPLSLDGAGSSMP